ncbi:MAG: TolC family protein [Proteobacteria bacterium]|nr:TolC family protein [Pseudomonadota bacterium]
MRHAVLLTIFLVLLQVNAWAEEEAVKGNILTLQTCIDKTLASHPDIRKLLFEVEEKNAAITSSKAAILPQIFVSAEYDPIKTFVMPQNGRFLTDDHTAWRAGIGLTQKIYDFGSSRGRIKASKLSKKMAALSLKEAKRLLIYNVQTLYDALLLQKAAMKAREEDIKNKEALYLQAQELVKNGLKTKADEASVLASVYSAKDAYFGAKSAFLKARVLMELYTGETIAIDTEYEDLLEKRSLIELGPKEEKELNAIFLDKNSKMQIQKQAIRQSEALLASAKGERYGTIDAVASYTRESNFSDYDTSMAGLKVEIPIFTGGLLKARVAQARASAAQAKEAFSLQKLKLLSEFEGTLIDLHRAEAGIQARKAGMAAAREASDLMAARYREGLSTYVEVLGATAQHLDAKLGLLQARNNKSKALYYIDYLMARGENAHE